MCASDALEILRNSDAITFDSLVRDLHDQSFVWCQTTDFLWTPFRWPWNGTPHLRFSKFLVKLSQISHRFTLQRVFTQQSFLDEDAKTFFFQLWSRVPRSSRVAVVGRSDRPFRVCFAEIFWKLNFTRVYSTNVVETNDFVRSLPLGLPNEARDSEYQFVLSDQKMLLSAYTLVPQRDNFDLSIYVNFRPETSILHRGGLLDFLKSCKLQKVIYGTFDRSPEGRMEYLCDLRKYNFVLCPQGNGIDTHRLWETLYVGGFPVVLEGTSLDEVLRLLPVVLLDSWERLIDEEYMAKEWKRLTSSEFQFQYLSRNHWRGQILKDSRHF
jgi:hypothetical protein